MDVLSVITPISHSYSIHGFLVLEFGLNAPFVIYQVGLLHTRGAALVLVCFCRDMWGFPITVAVHVLQVLLPKYVSLTSFFLVIFVLVRQLKPTAVLTTHTLYCPRSAMIT